MLVTAHTRSRLAPDTACVEAARARLPRRSTVKVAVLTSGDPTAAASPPHHPGADGDEPVELELDEDACNGARREPGRPGNLVCGGRPASTAARTRAAAEPAGGPLGSGGSGSSPIASSTSPAHVTGAAPSRRRAFAPFERAEVISPGTASTSRPSSSARSAVISAPLRSRASTTTVATASPGDDPVAGREAPRRGRDPRRVLARRRGRAGRSRARGRRVRAGSRDRCRSRARRPSRRRPRAQPRCAQPSTPRASPETTTTPAAASSRRERAGDVRPVVAAGPRADDRDRRPAEERGRCLATKKKPRRRVVDRAKPRRKRRARSAPASRSRLPRASRAQPLRRTCRRTPRSPRSALAVDARVRRARPRTSPGPARSLHLELRRASDTKAPRPRARPAPPPRRRARRSSARPVRPAPVHGPRAAAARPRASRSAAASSERASGASTGTDAPRPRGRARCPSARLRRSRQLGCRAAAGAQRRGRTGRAARERACRGSGRDVAGEHVHPAARIAAPAARAEVHRADELEPGGKEQRPPTRATAITPSSSGCRSASRTARENSGSSSSRRTPWWASVASPGRGPDCRHRRSAAADAVWCGARNGGVRIRPACAGEHPGDRVDPRDLERASSSSGGRIPGSRRASIVFPIPGGPASSRLCLPAAAISSTRRARSCPRTSARSGARRRSTSVAAACSSGGGSASPRKYVDRLARDAGPAPARSPRARPRRRIPPRTRGDGRRAPGTFGRDQRHRRPAGAARRARARRPRRAR